MTIVEYELLSAQASYFVRSGQPKNALSKLDEALQLNLSQEEKNRLLFQKYFVCSYRLNDEESGKKYLNEILANNSEDSEDYILASQELDLLEFSNTAEKSLAENTLAVETNSIPKEYALKGNFPNPFNPATTIRFALPYQSEVRIQIFNILGQKVKTISLPSMAAGYRDIVWDGKNNFNAQVSSGLYIYCFEAKSLENDKHFTKTAKMLVLK